MTSHAAALLAALQIKSARRRSDCNGVAPQFWHPNNYSDVGFFLPLPVLQVTASARRHSTATALRLSTGIPTIMFE